MTQRPASGMPRRPRGAPALGPASEGLVPLISASPHFLALLQPDGSVIEANDPGARALGLAAGPVHGGSFVDCPWWAGDDAIRDAIGDGLALASSGTEARLSLAVPGSDGARSIDLSLSPYRREDGTVRGIVVEAWDVSSYLRDSWRHAEDGDRLRQVSETLDEAIWLGETRTGKIVWASNALHESWGLPADGLTLAAVLERIHIDDRGPIADSARRLDAGETVECDIRLRRRDGQWRAFHARLTPLSLPNGKTGAAATGRYAAVALDVTEQRIAERARVSAERQFRELLEALDLYAITVDLDGRIAFVNEALAVGSGWPRQELEGRTDATAILGLNPIVDGSAGATGAAPERSVRREAVLTCRDGSQRVVAWNLAPLRDEGGRTIGVAAIGEDVTATRRATTETGDPERRSADEPFWREAERRLEASEERYRRIVETTLEGIWIVDERAVTTFVNPRLAEMLGWTVDEMVGRSLRDFVDDEGWTDAVASLERRAAGIAGRRVARFIRRDGSSIWTDVATNPIFDAGRYSGSLAVVSDITDRREREAELTRAYDQRRQLIGRLVRAQEQERTRVAREVHDDSVQVMTAASILVELLRDSVPDDAVRQRLDELSATVRESIARLRLLLFDLHPAALDRHGIAAALRQLAQQRAKLGGPPIRIIDKSRARPSAAIATVLFRIAQDALTNAIKYADATAITVTLRTHEGGTALSVADDGRGIEPAVLRHRSGSLGLAGMRERAELAGGTLEVSSDLGRGTMITAWVPNDEAIVGNGEQPR